MSYYGKKAAIEWKYTNECKKRYDNSNSTIKRLILETWYPIGTKITKAESQYSLPFLNKVYNITQHNADGSIVCTSGSKTTNIHPTEAKPTDKHMEAILRDAKLRSLGIV